MAREASTVERTEELKAALKSSSLKSYLYLEYWNNNQWNVLNDLDVNVGVNWAKTAKKYKYATTTLTPMPSSYSFTVINEDGKYSEGSGEAVEGVLDLDTKMRLTSGYRLGTATTIDTVHTANFSSASLIYHFFTKTDSTGIVLDSANSSGNADEYFQDLFDVNYDGIFYGGGTYTHDAYTVINTDLIGDGYENVKSFAITCNSTNGTIYYRDSNTLTDDNLTSANWTNAGSTNNGTTTVVVGADSKRYFQVAVVWDGVAWGDNDRIESLEVTTNSYMEWLYKDVFYLDTPTFTEPSAPNIPSVKCTGRDIFKRAIETDINLDNLNNYTTGGGGIVIDDLVKNICDNVGISYTASSIVDLSSYSNRTLATGLGQPEKAVNVFEKIMQILNQDPVPSGEPGYQLYLEYDETTDDNILFLQPKPSIFEADFVFNYQHYTSLGAKRKNYDKALKRVTVITNDQSINDEELLDSKIAQSGTGTQSFSWPNNAGYKRIVFTTTTDGYQIDSVSFTPTSASIDISALATGTAGTWDLYIYGNRWDGADPDFEGEAVDPSNILTGKGATNKLINPLVVSDGEAKAIADGLVSSFGTPVNEANNIKYPYSNLLLEINDFCLIWSRFTFVDDLYSITGINYHWDWASSPNDSTSFNLDDSGTDFSDFATEGFIYDSVLDYGVGYVYDMEFGPGATAAEIDAGTVIVNNVDCT